MAIELNRRIIVDWQSIISKNKGLFVVEKDYQFPGGYYVRQKNTPYFFPSGRYDIEMMIENALAALGKNAGPIILASEEEVEKVVSMTRPVMELLDTQLPGANGWYLNLLWSILNSVTVHPRAVPLK